NSSFGGVGFLGSQTLAGNGVVTLGNDNYNLRGYAGRDAIWLGYGGTTLTIGPGITIQGQNGVIGAYTSFPWYGPANVSVVNKGTISQSVNGGAFWITAQSFTNQATVAALQGVVVLNSGFVPASGTLTCGLNGPNESGQMQFSSNAHLGGTLSIVLQGSYVPSIGDSFTPLTYTSYGG